MGGHFVCLAVGLEGADRTVYVLGRNRIERFVGDELLGILFECECGVNIYVLFAGRLRKLWSCLHLSDELLMLGASSLGILQGTR